MTSPGFTMVAVGVTDPADGAEVAKALVAEHDVQLIELCGGFGTADTLRVQAAIPPEVPVGVVRYGPETIDHLHRLFAD